MFCMPSRFTAGDALSLRFQFPCSRSFDDVVTLRLRGPAVIDVQAEDDLGAFVFAATSEETSTWLPGLYSWTISITSGSGERRTVQGGQLEVLPDPAQVEAATDQRSFARRTLADLEAHIATKSTQLSFSVFGRSYAFESWDQLLDARDRLQREVEAEDGQSHFAAFAFGCGR